MGRAAICEDEKVILERICQNLKIYFQKADLSYTFDKYTDSHSLLAAISKGNSYDLYFLDIEMPEMDGISLAKKIRRLNSEALLIFISNKEELVFQTFEVRPFRFIRKSHFSAELPYLVRDINKELSKKKGHTITLTQGSTTLLSFNINELIYVEVIRKQCILHTTSGTHTITYQMAELAKKLASYGCCQIHRSYLVNFQYVYSIRRGEIILDNKETLPVGRTYMEHVKEQFQIFSQEL